MRMNGKSCKEFSEYIMSAMNKFSVKEQETLQLLFMLRIALLTIKSLK
jgi:hypothetical protein